MTARFARFSGFKAGCTDGQLFGSLTETTADDLAIARRCLKITQKWPKSASNLHNLELLTILVQIASGPPLMLFRSTEAASGVWEESAWLPFREEHVHGCQSRGRLSRPAPRKRTPR
jgi:hypothetical protein